MERITVALLAEAIQAALALPAGPRDEAARRLRASDGRGQIVRHLEDLAAANRLVGA